MASPRVIPRAGRIANNLVLYDVNPTGDEIGRGAYGRVFAVNYEGTICAAKEVHTLLLEMSQDEALHKIKSDFLSECQIWSTLRHPCVVQFLGVYYPASDQHRLPVMVMEKMEQSLRGLVEKYTTIPLNVKLSILDDVCLGLRYLHSRNPSIVHRDLSPNNILLGGQLEAKITDLGVAKVMETTEDGISMTKVPGTPAFMPPESSVTKGSTYGTPLDIFSYGGVILNIITQIWPEPSDREQLNTLTDKWDVVSELARRQTYLDKLIGCAAELTELVTSCLNDNPKRRPTVAKVSIEIKRVKQIYSQKTGHDGMSRLVWWASQQDEMISRTIELERVNNELKAENESLKTENSHLSRVNAENAQLQLEIQHLKEQLAFKRSLKPDLFSGPVTIKWEQGASAPVRIGYHNTVLYKGKIYIGGGNEPGSKPSHRIDVYHPTENYWSPSPINVPYHWFAMTILNSQLILAGGEDRSSNITNRVFLLNSSNQLIDYSKMITSRCLATAVGHQKRLLVVGGKDSNYQPLASTEVFDSITGQWYATGNLPSPHCSLQAAVADDTVYMLGGASQGSRSSPKVLSASLDTLRNNKLKWESHLSTPWNRSTPVSIQGKKLLVIGGRKKIGDRNEHTSDIYVLNKANHSWEAVEQIPSPRDAPVVVSMADTFIVIGGVDEDGQFTNTLWIGSCKPQ
ncbi:uncharacterized protein [Dysidea avara]|uniref:uncharacterized protein n=1 Tax=Dysidea avara TaxID=196820 RepID=UPI00331A18C2